MSADTKMATLRRFGVQRVRPWLAGALRSAGFVEPTPVQAASMDRLAHHENTVIHSATGTGKTLAFLVPLLSRLEPGKPLQLLILCPSRELALQMAFDANQLLTVDSPLNLALAVGGLASDGDHLRELTHEVAAGRAEILVATPQALARALSEEVEATGGRTNAAAAVLVARDDFPTTRTAWYPLDRPPVKLSESEGHKDGVLSGSDGSGGGDGSGNGGMRLLLELSRHLDAVVLDEVDALLPKPILSDEV